MIGGRGTATPTDPFHGLACYEVSFGKGLIYEHQGRYSFF